VSDTYYLMGGIRMAERPSQGVEDAQLNVHGGDYQFVTNSSVFPTGSNSRLQIKFYVTVNSETFLCAHLNKKRRK
jgi:hypothetical protein